VQLGHEAIFVLHSVLSFFPVPEAQIKQLAFVESEHAKQSGSHEPQSPELRNLSTKLQLVQVVKLDEHETQGEVHAVHVLFVIHIPFELNA